MELNKRQGASYECNVSRHSLDSFWTETYNKACCLQAKTPEGAEQETKYIKFVFRDLVLANKTPEGAE